MKAEIYYSECCGKYIAEQTEYKAKNILQVGRYKGTGIYYCSRCKKQTTKTGYLKEL